MSQDTLPELPAGAFTRQDEGDDLAFYAPPRLVTHIDEAAVAALSARYRDLLPPGACILDIMSSWVSHLPADVTYGDVVCHGMNARELAANRQADRWFVQDLNRNPMLPLDHGAFDAALCCVGVQYLQHPIDVFADVRRVLRPDAPFIVSFSNRCFPTKAVAIWRALDAAGHAALIDLYLTRAGFKAITIETLVDGRRSDPLTLVIGRA
ncbi:methyltransferase type 11 [Sphingomonas sp. Leaf339]|uniref:class I SAM-dependent methyltransferase n=1 Tax=Sphingomonas sp. Leaf339 TaxID=1736343 RepID=UPI000701E5FF|nr:methyltransferase domain-containing protein [Sphingomonas sp. Leaf339]KQU55640.1 methyltransferase type 11 [Sphingomonas sp. Leaf339]